MLFWIKLNIVDSKVVNNTLHNMSFNGGKLYHVYKTAAAEPKSTLSWLQGLQYINEFLNDEAKEAMEQGVKLLKVDGACSAIHRENGEWVFYQRQDNYKGNGETLPLPDGLQPAHYNQGGKEHNYNWLKVNPTDTARKGKNKFGPDTYAAIQHGVDVGLLPKATDPDAPEWITCEWVGQKHQGNMDGIPYAHALIPHTDQFLPQIDVHSLDEFVQLTKEKCFEGVVVIHPNGTRYKLRSDTVGQGNLWNTHSRKKPTDPRVTDITPLRVLTKDGVYTF